MDLVTPGYGLILWQAAGLVYIGFLIYALLDLVRTEFRDQHSKLFWVLIILIAPFGCFLYLANVKRNKKRRFNPDFSKISKP
jgi:membrane protein DedA with SNARE-associated domain